MNSVVYVNCNPHAAYEDDSFMGKLKDRFKIKLEGENLIKELGINIAKVRFPPNFNKQAYMKNIEICKKYGNKECINLAPKTYRKLDYYLLSDYQKNLFAYSVVKSIQLILRVRKKSIKTSCIAVYDAAESINERVLYELAKESRFIILLSEDILKSRRISDYIASNYGTSPVVTNDIEYVLKSADFIITSRNIIKDINSPVWYIDNMYIPNNPKSIAINDVTFNVPWNTGELDMSIELLGAILGTMEEKDIEKSLRYNGVMLDKIMFNSRVSY